MGSSSYCRRALKCGKGAESAGYLDAGLKEARGHVDPFLVGHMLTAMTFVSQVRPSEVK
jgi:hypothetical protein